MARRGSFTGLINQIARETARQERENLQYEHAQLREAERAHKQQMRLNAQASKEAKALYIENRIQETDDLNKDLWIKIDELRNILERTLQIDHSISFDDFLRIKNHFPNSHYQTNFKKHQLSQARKNIFRKFQSQPHSRN